ncbi:hypothetical protein ACFYNO_08680 [Kitasatospora sp. NPDC006697]|uniref:hypothetical protein n=1 Tax=Kitasatospora sp. NPDC006697 TaxID=3364020 RepID=UPI0036BA5555
MTKRPAQTLYKPQEGEVVHDAKHGVEGVYVGPSYTTKGAVELRPIRGGVAWDTPATEIRPVSPTTGDA